MTNAASKPKVFSRKCNLRFLIFSFESYTAKLWGTELEEVEGPVKNRSVAARKLR